MRRATIRQKLSVFFSRPFNTAGCTPNDSSDIKFDIENVTFVDLELSYKFTIGRIFQIPDLHSHVVARTHESLGRGVVCECADKERMA